MSLVGPLSLFLGAKFFYSTPGVSISHHWYNLKCLFDLNLEDCIPCFVPMELGLILKTDMAFLLLTEHTTVVLLGRFFMLLILIPTLCLPLACALSL
jgi:hypothetical protein